jgi:hypothetical protein
MSGLKYYCLNANQRHDKFESIGSVSLYQNEHKRENSNKPAILREYFHIRYQKKTIDSHPYSKCKFRPYHLF